MWGKAALKPFQKAPLSNSLNFRHVLSCFTFLLQALSLSRYCLVSLLVLLHKILVLHALNVFVQPMRQTDLWVKSRFYPLYNVKQWWRCETVTKSNNSIAKYIPVLNPCMLDCLGELLFFPICLMADCILAPL